MDLEKRVEQLEQELQILKNQIQPSLLDIREFVLTNAYPSLRAEAPATPRPVVYREPEPEAAPETPLPVRKVNLNEVETQPVSTQPRPVEEQLSTHKMNWSALHKLEDWVSRKVEKYGVQRTIRFIDKSAESGKISSDTHELLLKLVNLHQAGHEQPEEETTDRRNIVLRLIAGVGNAGANVKRVK